VCLMKFVSAFLTIFGFVYGALAQTPSAPVVIKDECRIVLYLEFSPNGGELARFCFGYEVVLLDTTNYRRARTFLSETEHTPKLREFAYSPDGTIIATVLGDSAQVWNAADQGKPVPKEKSISDMYALNALGTPLRVLEVHNRSEDYKLNVSSIRFSTDCKLLITAHGNGHMKVWNTSSWTIERELIADPDQRLDGIRFSPDGKLLITIHANGHVKVWNTSSWIVEGELIVADSHLLGAAIAPDSKTIIIGDKNGVLHDWSLATKAEIRTLHTFEGVGNISNVAFSPDGKTMVASYESAKPGAVMIWNTTDWIAQTESGYISAAFSKDGKLLALGGRSDIKLIDPDSRKQIRDIELPEMTRGDVGHSDKDAPDAKETIPYGVLALAFSPDGNKLAAGCSEGTVRLVKVAP
jgi:WD40 repeat protein